jgi:hypothetical protein
MQAVIPIALREQWIQERILEVFPGANIIPLTVEVMQEKLLYHDDNQTHIDNWSISWMVWTPDILVDINRFRDDTRTSINNNLSRFTRNNRRPGSIFICSYHTLNQFNIGILSEI